LFFTVPGAGGLPLAQVTNPGATNEAVSYYHHDGLGSTVALTQTGVSGAAASYAYDAFGQTATTSGVPYRFAGYRLDAATGLYYVHARMYSPALGRFLQPDPIGTAGGANLYAYVGNDPLNLTDPSGLLAGTIGDEAKWGLNAAGNYASWCSENCAGINYFTSSQQGLRPGIAATLDLCGELCDPGALASVGPVGVASGDAILGLNALAGDAALTSRGLGQYGGIFSSTTNAAGGEVWTSVGEISQNDFASIVNSGLMKGDVNILTGVHGFANGEMVADVSLYQADVASFGHIPGVNIYNIPDLAAHQISSMLNGPETTIGGFCHSGVCLSGY
jgi:RHS repeat-associated protein